MAFLDLFMSGAQRRNIGHFASIVKLALADKIITKGEQIILDRMAIRLNISDKKRAAIIKNPDNYPINPPVSYDDRIERLYNLTKMIFADSEAVEKEAGILVKVAVGLGFQTSNVDKITKEAMQLGMQEINLKDFTSAIKKTGSR